MPLSLGLIGAGGRMGRAIAALAESRGAAIAGGIGREGCAMGAHADLFALAGSCDVLIDFSAPDALPATLAAAEAAGTPIVIGTTGLSPEDHARIDAAAGRVAVLQTANTSLGVTLLAQLVEEAARRLGAEWDVGIVEMHHRHKRDAPSGTALMLGRAVAAGRGGAADGVPGYASLRGGTVAGDHQVIFAGEGERIEIGHRAEDRSIFARGAMTAAAWLARKPPGRYSMRDVLGLAP